jgi:hypothetical protein
MSRRRGQVAKTCCRSAIASSSVSKTFARSTVAAAPVAARAALLCGQRQRGRTSRRSSSPQLSMARAAAPIFSASCGRTRMIAGRRSLMAICF